MLVSVFTYSFPTFTRTWGNAFLKIWESSSMRDMNTCFLIVPWPKFLSIETIRNASSIGVPPLSPPVLWLKDFLWWSKTATNEEEVTTSRDYQIISTRKVFLESYWNFQETLFYPWWILRRNLEWVIITSLRDGIFCTSVAFVLVVMGTHCFVASMFSSLWRGRGALPQNVP